MELLLILGISSTMVVSQYFNKKMLSTEPIFKVVSLMFAICFAISTVLFIFFNDNWFFSPFIFFVSAVNAVALLFYGQAIKINLSQTFFLFPLAGLVPIFFSIILFRENIFSQMHLGRSLVTLVGLFLTFLAVTLFGSIQRTGITHRKWLWASIIYFFIAGVVNFMIKSFDEQGTSLINYLFSWYSGAFVGSLLSRIKERDWSFKVMGRLKAVHIFALGLSTFSSMALFYYGVHLIPATIIFPSIIFLNVLGVVLVGLFIFGERNLLGQRGWLAVSLGFIGIVLLIAGVYA